MDDVSRRDRIQFIKELFAPGRVITVLLASLAFSALHVQIADERSLWMPLLWWVAVFGSWSALSAFRASQKKLFSNPRHKALWANCEDRLKRFHEAIKSLRRSKIAEFQELPKTIDSVAKSLYIALRRADIVSGEIARSEGWMQGRVPPVLGIPSSDPQATELYRIADKNIAEYRHQYAAVIASVQRTEAQGAVFVTTLDTLRLKMLGYRLTGRRPELSSQDFLEAMSEAKLQLQAIDKALDELELGPFPTMIAAMPPVPEEAIVEQRLEGGSE